MLVVSRNLDEFITVVIPPSDAPRVVQVGYLATNGDKIRLGVQADLDIRINRNEVCREMVLGREHHCDRGPLTPVETAMLCAVLLKK